MTAPWPHIGVVLPVYNDWESLALLLKDVRVALEGSLARAVSFVVVDDGSTVSITAGQQAALGKARILRLNRNVGHQKAIAIGLAYVADQMPCDAAVVMDSDGEDRPQDLAALFDAVRQEPGKIAFARRTRRREGPLFRVFYAAYKAVFHLLTGKSMGFGNFCVLPAAALKKAVYLSEIWNHFSGGIVKSGLGYVTVPIERGPRLAGSSRMNFIALVMHGLSAIAVHVDAVAVRLLVVTFALIVVSALGALVVTAIKLFTQLAIPGWASTIVIGFATIFMQAFLVSLFLAFIVLTYRTQRLFIPAVHYKDYLGAVDEAA